VIHNDPYRGGAHLPEHVVIKPVYYDGELFGYVSNIAHMVEIGGMAVGGFAATATEVYQEGLRLPPVWLMREGEYNQDVWRVIMANHRAPRYSWGDLHAMMASLNVAEQRVHEVLDQHGVERIERISDELMDYAERWMRNELRSIPDGDYTFEDFMEDSRDPPVRDWIRVAVVVDDGSLLVDFTGSDPQGPHVVNCTYGVTASAVYNAIFQLVDDDIPHNEGAYRPITVVAPPGTVTNVVEPAPSEGRSRAGGRLHRRDRLQLSFRWGASRYREVLRALPLRWSGLGWSERRRRKQQFVHSEWQLHDDAGRDF
jgi:N-methylhydantoinase B/oxoprolinase/acetone carboxylase alpha subunit